ncbi:MAG: winged helix-turn-helix domain-containing protein [DPANN group archaeon]|nr:winged helix-turn-helix domain-containing protein [DPANN group archaeon]
MESKVNFLEIIMKVELYHTTAELKKLFRKEQNPRIATRFRGVYLAMMDKTAPQIAKTLGYARRTIQNWIYAYNRQGIDGLGENTGRGNTSKLNPDQIQWLRQRIEQGPTAKDGVCVFHAADIQKIIRDQFGIHYHVRSIRKLLKRLGYSYVSSRPEHPKGDPQARETFKKNSVIRSGKSVLIILEKD